jgi:hypothetical protein
MKNQGYSISKIGLILITIIGLSSCAVIRQGEVGVKRTIGKIQQKS